MDEDLLKLIKSNKIFSSLDEKACQQIAPKFTRVELASGETLFHQGDPVKSVFIVESGKLAAILVTPQGTEKIVGHIDPGETVGEAGALTRESRSLTVRALKDCVLYRISSKDFLDVCYLFPSVMYATIHPMIRRSRGLVKALAADRVSKHIIVAPANKSISLQVFYDKLAIYLKKHPNILVLFDTSPEFSRKDIDSAQIKQLLSEMEKNKRPHKTLYLLTSLDSMLARIILKKTDIVYLAADFNATPKIDNTILDRLNSHLSHFKNDPGLILLYPDNSSMPRKTANWLALTSFSLHHHVRLTSSRDFHRLIRFFRDRAVGVILGGGGTRGWSHLGVIKALREMKVPIDYVGGTSVGAMIAAAYAIHESYEDAYDRFYKIVFNATNSLTWRSLTWPQISLFNAKSFTRTQQEVFGNYDIEDLRIPFFCVSCNLATNTEVIHRSGKLWERVRASSSIPGLIPPMVIDNVMHLDGGLLNNLPVDVARETLGKKSRIIAVEISSFGLDRHKYFFPPMLGFWQVILAKLGFKFQEYRFPRFLDTFLRAVFIGSSARSRQNSLAANLAINLNLGKFRVLHSSAKQAEKLIELGYDAAMEELLKTKAKENKK